ncbi:MAG: hypothetical protein K6E59_06530 [Bacilli bacterium]|nr:hypothetical protein [Bacilli bacterium]
MAKKYKYILTLEDDIEVDSAEEIEGRVVSSSRSQTDPYSMKGVFDSYEEAKEAASKRRAYRVKIHYRYKDGGSQYYDSYFGWDGEGTEDPAVAFDPDELEEIIACRIDDYRYGDMYCCGEGYRYKDDEGTVTWFRFFFVKILRREIVEFEEE